jgi:hypothetical protein
MVIVAVGVKVGDGDAVAVAVLVTVAVGGLVGKGVLVVAGGIIVAVWFVGNEEQPLRIIIKISVQISGLRKFFIARFP